MHRAGVGGKRDATERDGHVNWPAGRFDRLCTHAFEDLLRRERHFRFAALSEDGAEAIVAGPADRVARTQAGVKPVAHLDDHAIDRGRIVDLVEECQPIDADSEISSAYVVTYNVDECLVQCFAQALAIIMTGQLVVTRKAFEARE